MRFRTPLYAFVAPLATAAVAAACSSSGGSASPSAAWPVDPKTGLRVAGLGPVPPLPSWPDNPATAEEQALGKDMFNDARLSGSGKTACSNCHFPNNDFQSGGPKDSPDRSYPNISPTLPRNTPSLNNFVYAQMARWDGSYFTNVFDLSVLPLAEANMNIAGLLPASDVEAVDLADAQAALYQRLTVTLPGYVSVFQSAFGKDFRTLSAAEVWTLSGKAIAAYLRIAVSRDSAFDRWNAGEDSAMSAAAVRGLGLFRGSARCETCHSGPLFTDFQFHNVATSPPGPDGTRPDEGRYIVTQVARDRGAFLTPTLRSASMTSPYFHDGSEVSMANVIKRLCSADVLARDPNHDPALDAIPPLTADQISDLVAFIEALRGAEIPLATLAPPTTLP